MVAAGRADLDDLVGTQGRVLTVADFLSTLTVEAAVHHLDLVVRLDPGPAAGTAGRGPAGAGGLLGRPLPASWDDVTAARRGTGREPLTPPTGPNWGTARRRVPPVRLRTRLGAGQGHWPRACRAVPSDRRPRGGRRPGGSAAAAWAARAGHDVVLADAAVFPRTRPAATG